MPLTLRERNAVHAAEARARRARCRPHGEPPLTGVPFADWQPSRREQRRTRRYRVLGALCLSFALAWLLMLAAWAST